MRTRQSAVNRSRILFLPLNCIAPSAGRGPSLSCGAEGGIPPRIECGFLVFSSLNGTKVILVAPFDDVVAELYAGLVREAEVDAKQNSAVDDLLYGLGEACEVPWILSRRAVCARHRKLHAVSFEEMLHGVQRRT